MNIGYKNIHCNIYPSANWQKYLVLFYIQRVGILLRKCCLLLSKRAGILLLFLIITAVFYYCSTYAKGKFIELIFRQDNNQPVVLDENEKISPGGFYSKDSKCYNSAKFYNIKEHKFQR